MVINSSDLKFVHVWGEGEDLTGTTLLLLHGTGGSEHDLVELGRSLLPGANLLSPRGQVSENGMLRFFRRLAEGVFDLDDLRVRTQGLAEFVRQAAEVYGFAPNQVIAVGYSNGANIAASLLLSGTRTLAGAALLHPMVPFEPVELPALSGVRVFVGAGRQDPLVAPKLTERLEELLTKSGADVTTSWQPGGHQLTRAELDSAQQWLSQRNNTSVQA